MTEEVQEQHVEAEQVEHVEAEQQEPVVQEAPKREWTDDDAEEARAFGWKSPDEWQGDIPAGYIDDPRRYLERAENFRPFKALKQKLETVESTYADRLRKLESVSQTALKAQRAQYEREIESIRAQKRAAVDSADVEAYEALERREQSLQPPQVETPQSGPDPQTEQAVRKYGESENGAWIKNPMLREQGSKLIDAALRAGMPLMTAEDQFSYAEAEIRKMYPAYFPAKETAAKPTPPPQRVDAGGLAGGAGKSGGAFTKLPPEAKGAFKKFVAEGLFKDTEEDRKRYADDYNAA